MTPDSPIKLVSELLDLPLIDSEGKYCGIVDDVELSGGPGKELKLKALLVGPGAYSGRLPHWAQWLVQSLAGDRLTRIPMEKIRTIGAAVMLECPGRDLGLHRTEQEVGRWIPRKGAM
jgi:sporulation protein YlmC with PRC-barrel domain